MTRLVCIPAEQFQLNYIFDKFHLTPEDLRDGGVLENDRDYFVLKLVLPDVAKCKPD